MNRPIAKIGDGIYHRIPESQKGIIINIKYDYMTQIHEYQVAFTAETEALWYYEHELSINKNYN